MERSMIVTDLTRMGPPRVSDKDSLPVTIGTLNPSNSAIRY